MEKNKINKKKYKKKIDTKYNLSVYWSFLKKYKAQTIFTLFITFIISVIYIIEKFLFKVVIDNGTEFANGGITSQAYISILLIVAGVFFSSLILKTILNFTQIRIAINLSGKMTADLKRRFFNHIINLSHSFHTTHKTGSLISRIIRGSGGIGRMNDVIIFNTAPLIFQLILVSGALIYFNLIPALVIFLTAVLFIGYSIYTQNKSKPFGAVYHKTEDIEKSNVADFLMNIDSIRYFGKEKNVQAKFKKLSENSKKTAIRYENVFSQLTAGQLFILGIGLFFLMYFPIIEFLEGALSIGDIVFIYAIYGNIAGPLWSFVHGTRQYYRAMIDFESLFQYAKIEQEVKDKPDAKEFKIREGEVEFKNIDFNYGKRKIFKKFNLKILKNKKYALVGHSGCGKSTLVNLLYRLYDVDKGSVLIDNKDIRDFKQESLRNEMSIVPQECMLFDDTIYKNIAFSKPDATKREIMRAMKFAQLDKMIEDFPKKEKTIVGERGVKLSGGEKQRVSIARAILADKKILVLDEATSSLDSQTEHEIQRDLAKLMKGRTNIIIAHRLSTIMNADKIIVMKKGKIVQMGNHNELIKQEGEYKKLWNLQKGGYIK